MSWKGYVDQLLVDKAIEEAAICGKTPGQEGLWSGVGSLQLITPEEIKKLAGDVSQMRANGPTIGGLKYMFLTDSSEDQFVFSMNLKSRPDPDGNTFPVCVGKSKTALVIAKGTKDAAGNQLTGSVFNMVKYLRDLGY